MQSGVFQALVWFTLVYKTNVNYTREYLKSVHALHDSSMPVANWHVRFCVNIPTKELTGKSERGKSEWYVNIWEHLPKAILNSLNTTAIGGLIQSDNRKNTSWYICPTEN